MQAGLRELLEKRRNRAIATVLGFNFSQLTAPAATGFTNTAAFTVVHSNSAAASSGTIVNQIKIATRINTDNTTGGDPNWAWTNGSSANLMLLYLW